MTRADRPGVRRRLWKKPQPGPGVVIFPSGIRIVLAMVPRLHALFCAALFGAAALLPAQEAVEPAAPPPGEEEGAPMPEPGAEKNEAAPAAEPAGENAEAAGEEQAGAKPEPQREPEKKINPREEARARAKAATEADLAMVDGKALPELVPLLGHERFRVREHAQKRLIEQLGDQRDSVGDLCYRAYSSDPDPEIRMRARAVLLELVQQSSGTGKRGFVGIGLLLHAFFDKNGEVNFAVRVTEVRADTPAQKAGLRVGDLITGIDDVSLNDRDASQRFMDIVGAMPPGREITLKYRRDGKDLEVKLSLMARPDLPEDNTPKADPEKLLRDWLKDRRKAVGG